MMRRATDPRDQTQTAQCIACGLKGSASAIRGADQSSEGAYECGRKHGLTGTSKKLASMGMGGRRLRHAAPSPIIEAGDLI